MTEHNLRVSARTLRASAGDDGPPWQFGGVAVAAGDVLHMDDGTRVLFTAEELKAAAETQAGEPLTVDHPEDDNGKPQYPPPTDETVGKVAKAGWVDDVEGVAYDATTHDDTIARGVQAGTYEVSVHPTFGIEEYDGDEADVKAVDINFRDLSVVSKGDSPSNTAEYGPNQALASWTAETDFSELEASTESDRTDKQGLVQSAVHGTLEALGLGPSDVDPEVTADASEGTDGDESSDTTTGAESPEEDDSNNMGNEETPEDDEPEEQTEGEPQTLADMTVDELGDALREQGFVTEDSVSEAVAEAQEEATKADKVDEIIAESDDYSEDDRESLMASADSLVDNEHDRVTGTTGQSLPGSVGARDSVTASFGSDDDEDLDAYGTGVAGE